MASGADAFIPKQRSGDELLAAVATSLSGRVYVYRLAQRHHGKSDFVCFRRLTKRRKEVLYYMLLGYSAKRTAEALSGSRRTIEAHRHATMERFRVDSIFELRTRVRLLADMLAPTASG